MREHHRHRIEAITKIVTYDCQRDQQSEPKISLKPDADSKPIKETVYCQAGSSDTAKLFRMDPGLMRMFPASVDCGKPFKREKSQETQCHYRHHRRCTSAEIENLRDHVKQNDRDDGTGTEAE